MNPFESAADALFAEAFGTIRSEAIEGGCLGDVSFRGRSRSRERGDAVGPIVLGFLRVIGDAFESGDRTVAFDWCGRW